MSTGADFEGASDFVKQRDSRALLGRRTCSERVNLLNMVLVVILNVLEVIVFISLETRDQTDEQKHIVVIVNSVVLAFSFLLTISLRVFGHNRCKFVIRKRGFACTRIALGCMIVAEVVIVGLQLANELFLNTSGLEGYAVKASITLLLVIFICLLLQYNCLVPPDTPSLPEKQPLVSAEKAKVVDYVIAQLPDVPLPDIEAPPKDGLTDAERAWRDEAEGKHKVLPKPKPPAPKPKLKEPVLSPEELAWRTEAEMEARYAGRSKKNPAWAKHSGLN